MALFDAIMAVEDDPTDYDAIQEAINSGTAWRMQGSIGRSLMAAIEAGECLLGKTQTTDYWGNVIPSRYDVRSDTKGGFHFVMQHVGWDEADRRDKL